MARTVRRNRIHGRGTLGGRGGRFRDDRWTSCRIADRDCYHEPKTWRRVGDRIVRDYDDERGKNRSKLERAAGRRILKNVLAEVD